MSRAFVKESDLEDLDPLPERTHSDFPNYISREGLSVLEDRVTRLGQNIAALKDSDQLVAGSQLAVLQRDLRYYEERLRRAIRVDPPHQCRQVKFGHTVTLIDAQDNIYTFTLVGEDESDVDNGRISWATPVARLLINREAGDEIAWPRGDGTLTVEIIDIKL